MYNNVLTYNKSFNINVSNSIWWWTGVHLFQIKKYLKTEQLILNKTSVVIQ